MDSATGLRQRPLASPSMTWVCVIPAKMQEFTKRLPFGPAACLTVKSSHEMGANLTIFLVAFSTGLKLMQASPVLCKPYPPPLSPTA